MTDEAFNAIRAPDGLGNSATAPVSAATMERPMLSANFSFTDLVEAGETWEEIRIPNSPVEPAVDCH